MFILVFWRSLLLLPPTGCELEALLLYLLQLLLAHVLEAGAEQRGQLPRLRHALRGLLPRAAQHLHTTHEDGGRGRLPGPHLGEAAHLVQLEQGGGEEGGQLVPEPAEEAQLGAGRRQGLLGPPPGHEGGDGVVRGQDLRPAQSQLTAAAGAAAAAH